MHQKSSVLIISGLMLLAFSTTSYAHCEIPCGIYDDQQRIEMIEEHITTVEKSMKMINQLSKEAPVNYNQLIRWVDNKEVHATKIQDIVFQYFMTQRIKPDALNDKMAEKKYQDELQALHQLAIQAMKAKQSTNLITIQNMRKRLSDFSISYLGNTMERFGLDVGAKAPDFEELNSKRKNVRLSGLYEKGPVVLIFYRGGWCPYCNLQLKQFQAKLKEFEKHNATIVALSVDTPENAAKTIEKQDLGYEIISNPNADVLKAYNLVYKVPDELNQKYRKEYNINIEAASSQKHHIIAIPAVFILDQSGRIVYSYANKDYKVRVSPEEVLQELEKMKN